MKNILGFDPNKFKYEKSDDKSTTLRHSNGHTITIAHNAIDPKSKEILKNLSNPAPGYGKVIQKAEGGAVTPYEMGLPCKNPNCKSHGRPHPNCRCYSFATGGKVGSVCDEGREHHPDCQYAKSGDVLDSGNRKGESSQGQGVRQKDMKYAKEEAKGRAQFEREHVKPKIQGLKSGGKVQDPSMLDSAITAIKNWGAQVGGDDPKLYQQNEQGYTGSERPDRVPMDQITYGKTQEQMDAAHQQNEQEDQNYQAYQKANQPAPQEDTFDDSGYTQFKRQGMSDGGDVTPDEPVGLMSGDSPFAKGGKVCHACGGSVNRKMYKAGSSSGTVSQDDTAPETNDKPMYQKAWDKVSPWLQQQKQAIEQANSSPAQEDTESQQTPVPPVMDQAQAQQSVDNQDQIQSEQSSPQSQPQTQQPKVVPSAAPHPMSDPTTYQQAVHDNVMGEMRAWSEDLSNGKIEPETFQSLFAKKDTLGKIGTLFGLMLSGAGSGLSHQPNAVLELMNKQIANDLEAQKQTSSNRQNYIKMAQQHELNKANILTQQVGRKLTSAEAANISQDAELKAQMLAQRGALAKIMADNDKITDPAQKQLANNAAAMMYQKLDASNSDMASRYAAAKAMAHFGNADMSKGQSAEQAFQQGNATLRMAGQSALADANEAYHIPGVVGKASVPVPLDIRNRVNAMQTLDVKGKDLLQFIKQHRGTWNPQTQSTAEQKLEEMKNFYNDSINGGALTAGRLKWYDEQFKKSPTDILPQLMGSTKKLEEVVNSNKIRRDLQLKQLGFPQQTGQQDISTDTIERQDPKTGRTVIYDAATKKPLRWK